MLAADTAFTLTL